MVEVVEGEYEVVKGWTPMLNAFSPPVSPRRERLLYQSFAGEEEEGGGKGEGEGGGGGEEEAGGMYVQWGGEGKDIEQEEQEGKE